MTIDKIVKIVSGVATVVSIGCQLAQGWAGQKQMDTKINDAVEKAVADKIK